MLFGDEVRFRVGQTIKDTRSQYLRTGIIVDIDRYIHIKWGHVPNWNALPFTFDFCQQNFKPIFNPKMRRRRV